MRGTVVGCRSMDGMDYDGMNGLIVYPAFAGCFLCLWVYVALLWGMDAGSVVVMDEM
ncbi:hypothetical protein BJX63DRAFT_413001, partial [Aspergillus granulosus]